MYECPTRDVVTCLLIGYLYAMPGETFGQVGQGRSVFKLNWLHVVIFPY